MSDPTGFNGDELQLPYTQWKALIEARRKSLSPVVRRWLGEWTAWDLACSPMDDANRRQIRYGHYLGWISREMQRPPA